MRYRVLICAVAFLSALIVSAQRQAAIPSTGAPGLDQYRASRIAIYTDDFGELSRYREADAKLKPPAAGENRVVFLGDSITDYWKLADYFPGKPYINRGVDGQTTPQMLVRFRQDVISLRPTVLVVLAGLVYASGEVNAVSWATRRTGGFSAADLAFFEEMLPGFSAMVEVKALRRFIENMLSTYVGPGPGRCGNRHRSFAPAAGGVAHA